MKKRINNSMFYKIVSTPFRKEIESLINNNIIIGFIPLGAPFFAEDWYHQAMVSNILKQNNKYEKEN